MSDREAVLEMMGEAGAVYLGTVSEGAPRVRALLNLRRREGNPGASDFCRNQRFTCYFATSAASDKVREIRADASVAVYYSDPDQTHGVELRGRAEILTDAELRRTLWQEGWRIYWRGGAEDPDYVVLRLIPTQASGWWGSARLQLDLNGA